MTIFEAVKSMVTPRMAAEHFGLSVSRNGMVCCPFHDDRHPSMKLYEDHYHCFGCQANGDVIAFTSKLFGITPLEAAQTPEEGSDDRFVEACHMLECTQYMLDLLTIGSHEERAELVKDMMKDNKITLLQERLQEIKEEMNE